MWPWKWDKAVAHTGLRMKCHQFHEWGWRKSIKNAGQLAHQTAYILCKAKSSPDDYIAVETRGCVIDQGHRRALMRGSLASRNPVKALIYGPGITVGETSLNKAHWWQWMVGSPTHWGQVAALDSQGCLIFIQNNKAGRPAMKVWSAELWFVSRLSHPWVLNGCASNKDMLQRCHQKKSRVDRQESEAVTPIKIIVMFFVPPLVLRCFFLILNPLIKKKTGPLQRKTLQHHCQNTSSDSSRPSPKVWIAVYSGTLWKGDTQTFQGWLDTVVDSTMMPQNMECFGGLFVKIQIYGAQVKYGLWQSPACGFTGFEKNKA